MNQIKALEQATTCIDEYIATLTKRISEAKTYITEQMIALDFLRAFPEDSPSEDEPWASSRTWTHLSLDNGTVYGLMLNYDAKTLEEIMDPLRWLAQRLGAYTIDDYPAIGRRAYIFSGGRFHFQVFFHALDGNVCKFVQVGVKEEPVYELRCEGAS